MHLSVLGAQLQHLHEFTGAYMCAGATIRHRHALQSSIPSHSHHTTFGPPAQDRYLSHFFISGPPAQDRQAPRWG